MIEKLERAALIRQAFRLEWLTLAWMTVEGAVAIAAGVAAGSLTLTAFGLDSVIELSNLLLGAGWVDAVTGHCLVRRQGRPRGMEGRGLLRS